MELFNKNGNAYNMIAHYEDRYGANHYFLELNSQFISAYDYDKKQKCWARGKYFFYSTQRPGRMERAYF